jgi:cold shock CspA family protein
MAEGEAVREMVTDGRMLWFNAAKGCGLIGTEEGQRLPVARSGFQPGEVPEGRCAGREVLFDVIARDGDYQAMNVRFPPEAAVRRARRRYGARQR